MRVTHNQMYSTFVGQMNNTLSEYLNTQYEGSTMKKVNAPSDDPASAAHILNYRTSIAETEQFSENVSTALGWLNQSDGVLQQVSELMNRYVELAQQASTGTMTEDNRLQISSEANELYDLMIELANTEFDGRFIFAGQNIDAPPYELGLGATAEDPELAGMHFEVTGELESSAAIRFEAPGGTLPPTTGDVNYSYTLDSGATWIAGVIPNGTSTINLGTAEVEIPVVAPPATINPYDPTQPYTEENGTSLIIRPAAIYKGYDDSVPPDVSVYGTLDPTVTATPQGLFDSNIQVRIDSDVNFNVVPQTVTYSYSEDNGNTWITKEIDSKVPAPPSTANALLRLPIPGGFFDLESNFTAPAVSEIEAGTQFAIQPQRADLDYESASDSYVTVNNIGKDVFGGVYTPQGTDVQVSAFGGASQNIFETLGKFIGALEVNDQQGCADALEDIKFGAMQTLTLSQADIGGRVSRLEATAETLELSKLDKTERMSYLEDVDVGQLTMDLSMQKMAYQTVLQSSSMIMNLNLTQFI